LRPISYIDANVIIICFSTISRESFFNVKNKWYEELKFYNCSDTKVILVGTKIDCRSNEQFIKKLHQKPISYEEGLKLKEEFGFYKYLECSSQNKYGINEIFQTIIDIFFNEENTIKMIKKKNNCIVL
jgi:GTPase SAR1 family protein